ncbi:uncharacterized protein [Panulirus ornatus]|uniref:uncharacterized protein n=1 Tax=Panulirus ornatus TaxID=150431 RepID=UPI003A8BE480
MWSFNQKNTRRASLSVSATIKAFTYIIADIVWAWRRMCCLSRDLAMERGPSVGVERGPSVGVERGPSVGVERGPSVGVERGHSGRGAWPLSGRGTWTQRAWKVGQCLVSSDLASLDECEV